MLKRKTKPKKGPMNKGQAPTDEHLMLKLSEGKLEACSVLFERYHVRLYNFFLRNTQDRALSEDLTQMVFERLLKYKSSFKSDKSFKSWVYQIARNVQTDHFKKHKNRISDFVEPDETAAYSQSISTQMESREQNEQLYKALAQLSADYKEIIVLTKLQKLKGKEVAEILNCSEGAVKVKVHRAMKELRKQFFKIDHI